MLTCLLICLASLSGIDASSHSTQTSEVMAPQYQNLLPYQGVPQTMEQRDDKGNLVIKAAYVDLGAWHGFHLPDQADYYGSFTGPLFIAQEYSLHLSDAIARFALLDANTGEQRIFAEATDKAMFSRPDGLYQVYRWDDVSVNLQLTYADNRTAIVTTEVKNTSEHPQQWQFVWQGQPFTSHPDVANYRLIQQRSMTHNAIRWQLTPIMSAWQIQLSDAEFEIWFDTDIHITEQANAGYRAMSSPTTLAPHQAVTLRQAHRYFHTQAERITHQPPNWQALSKQLEANQHRWQ